MHRLTLTLIAILELLPHTTSIVFLELITGFQLANQHYILSISVESSFLLKKVKRYATKIPFVATQLSVRANAAPWSLRVHFYWKRSAASTTEAISADSGAIASWP